MSPSERVDDSSGGETVAESRTESGSGDEPTRRERLGGVVGRIRTNPRERAISLVIATLAGLTLAWFHWLGLVVGGALVGLTSPTIRFAPAYGIGFGVVVLIAFAITLGGSLGHVLAMTPVVYVTVAAALGLPLVGSLVRGVG